MNYLKGGCVHSCAKREVAEFVQCESGYTKKQMLIPCYAKHIKTENSIQEMHGTEHTFGNNLHFQSAKHTIS